MWTNAAETYNGLDDDGNGFVDDIHGIAFDMFGADHPELLHPHGDMTGHVEASMSFMKGLSDLQSNIDSPEASRAQAVHRRAGALRGSRLPDRTGLHEPVHAWNARRRHRGRRQSLRGDPVRPNLLRLPRETRPDTPRSRETARGFLCPDSEVLPGCRRARGEHELGLDLQRGPGRPRGQRHRRHRGGTAGDDRGDLRHARQGPARVRWLRPRRSSS